MVVVAPAEPSHVNAILALLEEMDRFYGATDVEPLESRARQLNEALFSDVPASYALLAWDEGQLIGFAAYSFLWPAVGLTRSLYLKELYVAEAQRRTGVGRLLMRSVFEVAVKHQCSRVEWTTDTHNLDAQRFYALLDVSPDSSKVFYRLEGDDILQATES